MEIDPERIDDPGKGKRPRTDDSGAESDDTADEPASKRSRSKAITIHERYNDESASLKIISSDDVVFYIDQAHAITHSRVLKDMLEIGKGSELLLTDTTLERASILAILLDIWHGHDCPMPIPKKSCYFSRSKVAAVIALAKKYDCTGAVYSIQSAYRAFLCDEDSSPIMIFFVLAHLEDIHGCAAAISLAANNTWWRKGENERQDDLRVTLGDGSVFDVASWRADDLARTPLPFAHALLRATAGCPRPLGKRTDWDAVAKRFTRILFKSASSVA